MQTQNMNQARELLNTFVAAWTAYQQASENYNTSTAETDAAAFAQLTMTNRALESALDALYPVAVGLYQIDHLWHQTPTAEQRALYAEIATAMSGYYHNKLPWAY